MLFLLTAYKPFLKDDLLEVLENSATNQTQFSEYLKKNLPTLWSKY